MSGRGDSQEDVPMQLSIHPDNGVPIYEQLVRQVKYSVAEGVTPPGQVIPSVREMAKRLAINPNTVQRAYLQLQDEQVIHTLRGRGMVVSEGASELCIAFRQEILQERMTALLREALRGGLTSETLRQMFETSLTDSTTENATSPDSSPSADPAKQAEGENS
ncbi:MAG: GntR family transcriptional regulator [Aureliella sp.]